MSARIRTGPLVIPEPPKRFDIDIQAVRDRTDMKGIVTADLGHPTKKRWLCPFHTDRNPSLTVDKENRRYKCWSCGATGDGIDWYMQRWNLTHVEACRKIAPDAVWERNPKKGRKATAAAEARRPEPPKPAPKPEKVPAWHAADWQAAVTELVEIAEGVLWDDKGRPALEWLRSRGLEDDVIHRFRLGFLPVEGWTSPVARSDGTVAGIHHGRGILIPWPAPGDQARWVGANVRHLADNPFDRLPDGTDKCRALRGSERGYLYPHADILPTQGQVPALVCEGELDALLAWQEIGHRVHVGTVGGAKQNPHRSALLALARCPWWLLALDHDQAGVDGARLWHERAPHKARRLLLPHGGDIGEFLQGGGDLRVWLAEEATRFNIRGIAP